MIIKSLLLIFVSVGLFLLVQVAMPFLAFKFWEVTAYQKNLSLVDPSMPQEKVLGVSIENIDNFPAIISHISRSDLPPYKDFRLNIPSINLDWGVVKVDSNNFENLLAHLPGSPLPGERGNVFITGHSTLTALYKPYNYKSVFSNLPKVKKGDEIILEVLGQKFNYIVEGIKITDPKDLSVVNPPNSQGRYLSLMTCVPPGFNTKRLVVLAKLK